MMDGLYHLVQLRGACISHRISYSGDKVFDAIKSTAYRGCVGKYRHHTKGTSAADVTRLIANPIQSDAMSGCSDGLVDK